MQEVHQGHEGIHLSSFSLQIKLLQMPSLNPMGWRWDLCRGRLFSSVWAGGLSIVFLQEIFANLAVLCGRTPWTDTSVYTISYWVLPHWSLQSCPLLTYSLACWGTWSLPESAAEHSDLLRSALMSLISVLWYQVWNVIFIKMPFSAVHRRVGTQLWFFLIELHWK